MNAAPLASRKIMDGKTAVPPAARRYCQERFSDWSKAYADLQSREVAIKNLFKPGWDCSREGYGVFSRYRIEVEVPRLAPAASSSLLALRSPRIRASDPAEERLIGESGNAIAVAALREEAGDYQALLQALRGNDLPNISRLSVLEPTYRGGGEQCGTPGAANWVVYAHTSLRLRSPETGLRRFSQKSGQNGPSVLTRTRRTRRTGTIVIKLTTAADGTVPKTESSVRDKNTIGLDLLKDDAERIVKAWTFGCAGCSPNVPFGHTIKFIYKQEDNFIVASLRVVKNLPDEVTVSTDAVLAQPSNNSKKGSH
jgi:hypothetical protein